MNKEQRLKRRVKNINKWARRHSAQDRINVMDLEEIIQACASKCFYCKIKLDVFAFNSIASFDHVKAMSQAGRNIKENLVLACMPCNNEKSKIESKVANQQRKKLIKDGLQYPINLIRDTLYRIMKKLAYRNTSLSVRLIAG